MHSRSHPIQPDAVPVLTKPIRGFLSPFPASDFFVEKLAQYVTSHTDIAADDANDTLRKDDPRHDALDGGDTQGVTCPAVPVNGVIHQRRWSGKAFPPQDKSYPIRTPHAFFPILISW